MVVVLCWGKFQYESSVFFCVFFCLFVFFCFGLFFFCLVWCVVVVEDVWVRVVLWWLVEEVLSFHVVKSNILGSSSMPTWPQCLD